MENLFAALAQFLALAWHEGVGIDRAHKPVKPSAPRARKFDYLKLAPRSGFELGGAEAVHAHSFGAQPLDIDVGHDERVVSSESGRLREHGAVLRDQAVAR